MPARTKLIQGTFILTFVGILSRFMGFFFRMFTSHIFGEENVGLYQLIFPLSFLISAVFLTSEMSWIIH